MLRYSTGRSASHHPVFPNEGTVERRRDSAEDDANDNPGPQIPLPGFVHLTHRELVLLRSGRLRVTWNCLCYSVSSHRNRAYRALISSNGDGATQEMGTLKVLAHPYSGKIGVERVNFV